MSEELNGQIKSFTKEIELENDPQRKAIAYTNRGATYSSKGDYARAIEDYYKAIELDPNYALAYANRGVGYINKGDNDRAIKDYDKVIELDPNYALAYATRGFAYSNKGNYDRAIKDYDKAIELDPNYALPYATRGFAYSRKGDYARAIKDYDKVIELDPNYALAYTTRGIAYSRKGDYARAIEDYDKAIELDRNYAPAYANRGVAYLKENKENFSSAFQNFVKSGNCDETLKSANVFVYIASLLENNKSLYRYEKIKFFEYCVKLVRVIEEIRKKLFYKESQEVVAHYTSLDVLKSLGNENPFRLYNAAYMSDPEEGEVFFRIMKNKVEFDVEEIFYKKDSEDPYLSPAYIGSFVRTEIETNSKPKDKLFLWRTYGKNDNEEAAGACLVFKGENFSLKIPPMTAGSMSQLMFQPKSGREQSELAKQDSKAVLYKVAYRSEIEENGLLEKLKPSLETIQKFFQSHENKNILQLQNLVRELLDSIRFLFKEDDYKEEKEVRVVEILYSGKLGKEDAEQTPPRFYLEMPGNARFSEVILGPKADGVSEWKQWLKEKGIKNVKKSEITFGRDSR